MELGIALPNGLGREVTTQLVLDWARLADELGFDLLATVDRPSGDTWDPIACLTAAAVVTRSCRLATTILQLPLRNDVLVAKEVATLDRLSGGRAVLGVGLGAFADDYALAGIETRGRGARLGEQVASIRETWRLAHEDPSQGGPAPQQRPGPPVWLGGASLPALERALALGDGYVFGSRRKLADVHETLPGLRARAPEGFTLAKVQYVAAGGEAQVEAAERNLRLYYRDSGLDARALLLHGSGDQVASAVAEFAGTGLDLLVLVPQVADLDQVHLLRATLAAR